MMPYQHRQPKIRRSCPAGALALALTLLSAAVLADDEAAPAPDGSPGSPRPPGLGLAPEAPPVPPAPGGRAPSFGEPENKGGQWSFTIGGSVAGTQSIGIARKPQNPPVGYDGTPLHAPAYTTGRGGYGTGAIAGLNLQYGNSIVNAVVIFNMRLTGKEAEGFYNPQSGSGLSQAYLVFRPEKIGAVQLQLRAGAYQENFGGPGQWGWGIYGPLLAVRGYGETLSAAIDASADLHFELSHGVLSVPGVPEEYPRGLYNTWFDVGTSSFVQHAHAGINYKDQYLLRLHWATDWGTDERTYSKTFLNTSTYRDGRIDNYVVEAHWIADPYGQIGVSGGFWNFFHALSVGDGIWWGLDWTEGGREMTSKFLGPASGAHGKIGAISAEYDTSVARILNPTFDGNGPDLRVAVAGIRHWTIATEDPGYQHATGYYLGLELEYRMLSWLGWKLSSYGENRDYVLGNRYSVWSVNPGVVFRANWTATDMLVLGYSRRFYSHAVDNNPEQPLDRDVISFGAYASF